MRTSQIIRRGRGIAVATLIVASIVGLPAMATLSELRHLSQAVPLLVVIVIFGLGAAIGAAVACSGTDRTAATRRALLYAAVVTAAPAIIAGFVAGGLSGVAALTFVASVWGAATAAPTLPLVHAVVDANARPSLDALDRVCATAFGFVAAVKLPEAVGATLLGEAAALALTATLGTFGLLGFVVFQQRRRARAARVREMLLREDEAMRLVERGLPAERAPLLSGEALVAVVRVDGPRAYRDGERQELIEVVPAAPLWPDLSGDVWRLGLSAAVALVLSLVSTGLARIAMFGT